MSKSIDFQNSYVVSFLANDDVKSRVLVSK